MPPTDCDPNDNCTDAGLFGGRCCQQRPKMCDVSTNLCVSSFCDLTQGCVQIPLVCPSVVDPTQAHCWSRSCAPTSGLCSSTFIGQSDFSCNQFECQVNSDCDDHNVCTTDECVGAVGQETCSWSPANCDDGNACTHDTCISPSVGCQHALFPASYCDDHNNCTDDSCDPLQSCQHFPQTCDDGEECTADTCDSTVGHCIFTPKVCPSSNDNCTLNYCMIGACSATDLCPTPPAITGLTPAQIGGVATGGVLAAGALAVGGFVAFKIIGASSVSASGGTAGDFAAE